jgi:phenylacetate-CoA ligase
MTGVGPYYDRALDFEALRREYPPAAEYFETTHRISRDELRSLQEQRFLKTVERGWQVPFYHRHWRQHGLEPGAIRSLDDLRHVPPYSVHDLRDAMGDNPPFTDYIGLDPKKDAPLPLVLHTSGGTTGLPRPMLYSPRDRELFAVLGSRGAYMRGIRPFDLVQVTMALGLSNGGMQAHEVLWKYTGAIPVMTGSGASTPTRRQIEIMKAWGISHLQGFPAYLRHMAEVARNELDLDVRTVGLKSIFTHLGLDCREELEELWGTKVFDGYGTNEVGAVAGECEHRSGMHIYEDAFIMEINDVETMQPVPHGETGTMFMTALFKELGPVIRFNTNDVSAFVRGQCACGGTHHRLEKFYGRSDNMIKVRGVNVFPEAVGAVISAHPVSNGEYICLVDLVGADRHEELTVRVEVKAGGEDREGLAREFVQRLKEGVGVSCKVEIAAPGELEPLTGFSTLPKARRLIDRRK